MNNISIANKETLTMSSLEIAELTGKQHKHVIADVRKLCFSLGINSADFSAKYKDQSGKENRCFNLPKRECLILISGYNIKLRARIIDRWQELELKQQPQIPTNFAEALQLAADQAKQLELQAPKVAFVDNLVDRKNLMTATQVAAKHSMSAVKLNKLLDELGGVYNKSVKRGRVFIQSFIDSGYGELKQTEQGYSQALFTPAGEVYIHEKLISEGVV